MYVRQLSLLQLLRWASYRHFYSVKRDCLRLFVVVYKLVMLMLRCWQCIACIYRVSLSLVLI